MEPARGVIGAEPQFLRLVRCDAVIGDWQARGIGYALIRGDFAAADRAGFVKDDFGFIVHKGKIVVGVPLPMFKIVTGTYAAPYLETLQLDWIGVRNEFALGVATIAAVRCCL